jgi:hypothetical protein
VLLLVISLLLSSDQASALRQVVLHRKAQLLAADLYLRFGLEDPERFGFTDFKELAADSGMQLLGSFFTHLCRTHWHCTQIGHLFLSSMCFIGYLSTPSMVTKSHREVIS